YPGIDVEWTTGVGLPLLRFVVAPGADVRQLAMRLQTTQTLGWTVFGSSVVVWSANFYTFDALTAYQSNGTARTSVKVTFVQTGENTFGLSPDAYDTTRPLTIEANGYLPNGLGASLVMPSADGGAILGGDIDLVRLRSDGSPVYMTLL